MATERDFITPAGVTVSTTANVVGNTTFTDISANSARAQTLPVFSQNFAMNPYLNPQWSFTRASNATYLAANGVITTVGPNVPRFDYDPVTLQCKGLLLEETRSNFLYNSTLSTNTANWSYYDGIDNTNMALVANAGTAPDLSLIHI